MASTAVFIEDPADAQRFSGGNLVSLSSLMEKLAAMKT